MEHGRKCIERAGERASEEYTLLRHRGFPYIEAAAAPRSTAASSESRKVALPGLLTEASAQWSSSHSVSVHLHTMLQHCALLEQVIPAAAHVGPEVVLLLEKLVKLLVDDDIRVPPVLLEWRTTRPDPLRRRSMPNLQHRHRSPTKPVTISVHQGSTPHQPSLRS